MKLLLIEVFFVVYWQWHYPCNSLILSNCHFHISKVNTRLFASTSQLIHPSSTSPATITQYKALPKVRYLVEFRDVYPQFRMNELLEIYQDILIRSKYINQTTDDENSNRIDPTYYDGLNTGDNDSYHNRKHDIQVYLSNDYLDIETVIYDGKSSSSSSLSTSLSALSSNSSSSTPSAVPSSHNVIDSSQLKPVIATTIALDPKDYESSVCMYMNFPSEEFAIQVAQKSSLIRSIIHVYGDGITPQSTCENAYFYNSSITPSRINTPTRFNSDFTPELNSWRINFRRYGRQGKSGLDYAGKQQKLSIFQDILMNLYGTVDLDQPVNELIYLEDWHDYHTLEKEKEKQEKEIRLKQKQQRQLKQNVSYIGQLSPNNSINNKSLDIGELATTGDSTINSVVGSNTVEVCNTDDAVTISSTNTLIDLDSYTPKRYIFGRIIAQPTSVTQAYDIRFRPFIGTTTMDSLSSHLTAVAASVGPGDVVLDPYCGTGSLLIAAASLGASVMGSDYDSFNFQLLVPNEHEFDECNIFSSGDNSSNNSGISSNNIDNNSSSSDDDSSGEIIRSRDVIIPRITKHNVHNTRGSRRNMTTDTSTTIKTKTAHTGQPVMQEEQGSTSVAALVTASTPTKTCFKRASDDLNQSEKSLFDDFVYYNMTDRCIALINSDSVNWIPTTTTTINNNNNNYYIDGRGSNEKCVTNDSSSETNNVGTATATTGRKHIDEFMKILLYKNNNTSDDYVQPPSSLLFHQIFGLPQLPRQQGSSESQERVANGVIIKDESNRYVYSLHRSKLKLQRKLDAIISDPPFGIREKAFGHCQQQIPVPLQLPQSSIISLEQSSEIISSRTAATSVPTTTITTTSNNNNNTTGSNTVASSTSMGDCKRAVATLFSIAKYHLKPTSGKLVFWLPTPATVASVSELRMILSEIEDMVEVGNHGSTHADVDDGNTKNTANKHDDSNSGALNGESMYNSDKGGSNNNNSNSNDELVSNNSYISNDLSQYLVFRKATPQYLHSKLTRWLCVYERTSLI